MFASISCFIAHPILTLFEARANVKRELFFTVLKIFTDFLTRYGNNPDHMAQRTPSSSRLVPALLELFAASARDLPLRHTKDLLRDMDKRNHVYLRPVWKPICRWTTTILMAEDFKQYATPTF
jgi:hypothetical protein